MCCYYPLETQVLKNLWEKTLPPSLRQKFLRICIMVS